MNPLARERRSRDTRPQPAWRNPATPCKADKPPLRAGEKNSLTWRAFQVVYFPRIGRRVAV